MANKLRLSGAPQATNDGSGMVAHDIIAVTDEGNPIPGRHPSIQVN